MSLVLCPKCQQRNWSQDYFICSNCGYEESREWMLLEENKDFSESRNKGDNPALNLNFWMEEQENLTKEMVNECLPKEKHNYVVDCKQNLIGWGGTEYHENDFQEAELFIKRHRKELIKRGCVKKGFIYYVDRKGRIVDSKLIYYPIYPPYSGILCCPCPRATKIIISNWTLTTEGSYYFDGDGYFPTIPHEVAHASPEVHRHPNYQPFSGQYDPSRSGARGHDTIWRNKHGEFYNKLKGKGYIEKVKERFKELRKIKREEN